MSGVFVRQIMGVDHLRSGCFQDGEEVLYRRRVGGILHGAARVIELNHGGILPDHRGLLLFTAAHGAHLIVGVVLVEARAGTPRPVGAGYPPEPLVVLPVTGLDSVKGHELKIILVGSDPQVGNPGKRDLDGLAGRDVNRGAGTGEIHGRRREARERGSADWQRPPPGRAVSSVRPEWSW